VKGILPRTLNLSVLAVFLLPLVTHAQGQSFTFKDPLSQTTIVCALKGFVGGIYLIGTPVAALAIVYSGFLLVRARGNPAALGEARKILFRVLLGVGLFLGSWLLILTLANTINAILPGTFSDIARCNS